MNAFLKINFNSYNVLSSFTCVRLSIRFECLEAYIRSPDTAGCPSKYLPSLMFLQEVFFPQRVLSMRTADDCSDSHQKEAARQDALHHSNSWSKK